MQGHGAFRVDQPSLPITRRLQGHTGVVFNFYRAQAGQKRRCWSSSAIPSASGRSSWRHHPRRRRRFFSSANRGDCGSPSLVRPGCGCMPKKQFKPSWYTPAEVEAHSETPLPSRRALRRRASGARVMTKDPITGGSPHRMDLRKPFDRSGESRTEEPLKNVWWRAE